MWLLKFRLLTGTLHDKWHTSKPPALLACLCGCKHARNDRPTCAAFPVALFFLDHCCSYTSRNTLGLAAATTSLPGHGTALQPWPSTLLNKLNKVLKTSHILPASVHSRSLLHFCYIHRHYIHVKSESVKCSELSGQQLTEYCVHKMCTQKLLMSPHTGTSS